MIPTKVQVFHKIVEGCVSEFIKQTDNDPEISGTDAVAAIGSLGVALIEQCAMALEHAYGNDAASKFLGHAQVCLEEFRKQFKPNEPVVDRTMH